MLNCFKRALLVLCLVAPPSFAAVADEPPAGQNQAFPPAIAAWTEADFSQQRNAAVQLNKDLQAAIQSGAKTFTIPPGNYRFHPDTLRNLVIKDAHDLVIDGSGATFWLYPFQRIDGIIIEHCRNVTVRNLIIDYYPATYPQGNIVAIDQQQGFIDFQLAPGFSTPMDVPGHLTGAKLLHFDQKGNYLEAQMDWVRDAQDLGQGRYRIFPIGGWAWRKKTEVVPGTILAVAGRTMRMVFNLHNSDHCTLEDITAYASPHMVFTEGFGEGGHTYRRCKVVLRPGTRRVIACNADIFHSIGVARGPTIEDCEFSRSGDDIMNIHGLLALTYDQPAPNQVDILSQIAPDIPVNTTLHWYNLDSLEPLGEAKVISTTQVNDPALTTPAEAMITEKKLAFLKPACLIRVQLDRPVSVPQYTLVGADSRIARGTVIRRNFLHDSQSHAILLKSADGLIEENHIDNVGIASIGIANDSLFMEGPFSSNITIQNNLITRNGQASLNSHGDSTFDIGAISVTVERKRGLLDIPANVGIRILNNKIIDSANDGIFMSNVRGGAIVGNTIIDAVCQEPMNLGMRMGLVNPAYGLVIANCEDITVDKNEFIHPGKYCRGNMTFIDAVKNAGPQHP